MIHMCVLVTSQKIVKKHNGNGNWKFLCLFFHNSFEINIPQAIYQYSRKKIIWLSQKSNGFSYRKNVLREASRQTYKVGYEWEESFENKSDLFQGKEWLFFCGPKQISITRYLYLKLVKLLFIKVKWLAIWT